VLHSGDDDYGSKGKDLLEFELGHEIVETKWERQAQNKILGDRRLNQFSRTLVIDNEDFGSM
jgi:hypothetical protein